MSPPEASQQREEPESPGESLSGGTLALLGAPCSRWHGARPAALSLGPSCLAAGAGVPSPFPAAAGQEAWLKAELSGRADYSSPGPSVVPATGVSLAPVQRLINGCYF